MTEKRFTSQRTDDYNYSDILDNGKWIGICHVDCEDDFVDKLNELNDKKEQLKKENRTLKLLVQNWEQLDDEKDEQLEKMNDSLKRLVEKNKQLQQELFESEYENICERYRDNSIRRESWVEDLKEEFKERFGRDFEYE